MTAKEVLIAAADRIEKLGWCQGAYALDGDGKPCRSRRMGFQTEAVAMDPIAAIRWFGPNDEGDEAKAMLMKHVKSDNLAQWNDDPERTKEQVIAAIRKAAK